MHNKVEFFKTHLFVTWLESQTAKVRSQIDGRLERIQQFGHYGHRKKLSAVLCELKFNNGTRIYYTEKMMGDLTLILILGGHKNGQDRDIKRAQKIAEKIHCD